MKGARARRNSLCMLVQLNVVCVGGRAQLHTLNCNACDSAQDYHCM